MSRQHGCDSWEARGVHQAVRTTHCTTETSDTLFTPQDSQACWCDRWSRKTTVVPPSMRRDTDHLHTLRDGTFQRVGNVHQLGFGPDVILAKDRSVFCDVRIRMPIETHTFLTERTAGLGHIECAASPAASFLHSLLPTPRLMLRCHRPSSPSAHG